MNHIELYIYACAQVVYQPFYIPSVCLILEAILPASPGASRETVRSIVLTA